MLTNVISKRPKTQAATNKNGFSSTSKTPTSSKAQSLTAISGPTAASPSSSKPSLCLSSMIESQAKGAWWKAFTLCRAWFRMWGSWIRERAS